MKVHQILNVGEETVVVSESETQPLATVFEDDGETGYFYAVDLREEKQIVDALHIYNADSVIDRQRESKLEIVWSADGWKSMLLINGYPHAVFDFETKRGYCRNNFPEASSRGPDAWQRCEWHDSIADLIDVTVVARHNAYEQVRKLRGSEQNARDVPRRREPPVESHADDTDRA